MASEAEIPESSPGQAPRLRLGTKGWNRPMAADSTGPRPTQAGNPVAPNKANPGRGGLGIDYGLRIIDDLETQMPGGVAPNKANLACHAPAKACRRGIGRERLTASLRTGQTKPIRPGHARPGNPKLETRNPKQIPNPNDPNGQACPDAVAPNKANPARSVPVRASGENALRRHYQQGKQSQFGGFWRGNGVSPQNRAHFRVVGRSGGRESCGH